MSAPQPGRYHADYSQRGYITHDLPRNAVQPARDTESRAHVYSRELTPREQAVWEGIAGGLYDKEIALALGIALSTTKAHIKSIKRKLTAESRVEMAMRWYGIPLHTPYQTAPSPPA